MTKHFDHKLNFQVLFNSILSNTVLLPVIQHGFIQSMSLLVQPLLHTKHQGLGQLSLCPGRAAQSFVALTGEPSAESLQVCEGRSP